MFTEIDRSGHQTSVSTSQMYREALDILCTLQSAIPADRGEVVLCYENVLDFIPAAWACVLGGYRCIPWHFRKTLSAPADITKKLHDVLPRLDHPTLVTTTELLEVISRTGTLAFENVICTDDGGTAPDPGGLGQPHQGIEAETGEFLIPTSGTTAKPKLARLGNQTLLSRFRLHELSHENRPGLVYAPFDSVAGLSAIYPPDAQGYYLQPDRFVVQPLGLLEVVEEFRLETFSLSSSSSSRLLDSLDGDDRTFDLSSLVHLRFGAEVIVPTVVAALIDRFRELGASGLEASFGYSMTEASFVTGTGRRDIAELVSQARGGTEPVDLGPCNPGWQLRVVDDDGLPCAPGAPGTIQVRSEETLFSGYHNDPELTDASFTEDGWFITGDQGRHEGGRLRITGRKTSTIIVRGRNISLDRIEAPLRQLDGIRPAMLAAGAIRTATSVTDELGVFFVPKSTDAAALDMLCREMTRETARGDGVTIHHLVPLAPDQLPLTSTGKIRRDQLVADFEAGLLEPHLLGREDASPRQSKPADTERWLAEVWKEVLNLEVLPSRDDDFFELGADSLASAQLIATVEEHLGRDLQMEEFFERPTIAALATLFSGGRHDVPGVAIASPRADNDRVLHTLQSFVGSWTGERRQSDSLVVGVNTTGRKLPIFWVCQSNREFQQLGKYLGPDQPLYGMRSCVEIVETKDHTAELIEAVSSRYVTEILALPVEHPVVIGGNCQGGMFACAIATRLHELGCTPERLVLLEWTFSMGRYDPEVLLVYGRESHTARLYDSPDVDDPDWRRDFPNRAVVPLRGHHGDYFSDRKIPGLIAAIQGSRSIRAHSIQISSIARRRVGRSIRSLNATLRRGA